VLVRLSLLFALILACSGCFQISKASRDDDEEWGAKWGTDEPEKKKAPPPAPKPAISEKDRKESFIPLPPPSPMEGKQSAPAKPKTMESPPPPEEKPPPVVAKKKPKKKKPKKKRKKKIEKLVPEEPPIEEPPLEPTAPPAPVMYPGEAAKEKPAPEPVPAPVPAPVPEKKPEPEKKPPPQRPVTVTPAVTPSTESLFMLEVVGGVMMIPRGTRFQPGGGLAFGLNLGNLAGWKGLYLTADLDILVGERQLYSDTYLLIDGLVGMQGRIPVWKLKIVAGLGFGIRYMLLTGDAGESEPELGFGGAAVAGVEVPINALLSAVVLVDGRYMKEPEFGSFHLTSMFSAGVVFHF